MRDFPIGRLPGVFGLRGELKCDPSGAGRSCFFSGAAMDIVLKDGTRFEARIASVREHKARLLVRFHGVDDANEAQRYAGATLYGSRDDIELEEGEYLDIDLVGCRVRGVDGRDFGLVERVEHYPASAMLIVAGRMLPMVDAFVKSVDIEAKAIVVDVPPGLMDDDAEEA